MTLPNEADRNKQFGSLFLSLGHAMHLMQDTSVPQHVRDDLHCDDKLCKLILLYHPSKYEAYTYYDAPISSSTYGPVEFPHGNARSFLSNDAGSGIAQFTNLNFLSVGTMNAFGTYDSSAKYPRPAWNGVATVEPIYDVYQDLNQPVPQQVASACPQGSASSSCDVNFLASTGADQYTKSSITNSKAATMLLFDDDLKAKGDTEVFALNRANYQAAWSFLIPRAVAYSTGLINYFFRGKLDVQSDENNPGGYVIINKGSFPMSGTFALYYDDANGNRYPVPGASWSNVTLSAAGNDPADQYSIQFSAPTSPAPATPGQYMLVFKGKIGSEDGVAGKSFGAVTHYLYTSTDQLCGGNADCATVWAFTDDFNFNSLRVIDTQEGPATGFPIYDMAVYAGVDFVINQQFDPYPPSYGQPPNSGCDDSLAKIQNLTILRFPCWGDAVTTTLDAIAVNTNYLYVSGTDNPGYVGNIFVFDHKGNYIKKLANTPAAGLWSLAANDSRLCLSGWTNSGYVGGTVLTDLNGNAIATWPGDPDFGGGPCALTKDRVYVLAWCDLCNATLNVYDLNGNLISSQVVDGSLYVDSITATDSHVYISAACESVGESCSGYGVVMVYDRVVTYNSSGQIASEQLIREPDISVPWTGPYTSSSTFWGIDAMADMRDVLGGSGN